MANRIRRGSADILGVIVFFAAIVFILAVMGFSFKTLIDSQPLSKEFIAKIPTLNVTQAEIDKVAEDGEITCGEYDSLVNKSRQNDRRDFIKKTLSGQQKD